MSLFFLFEKKSLSRGNWNWKDVPFSIQNQERRKKRHRAGHFSLFEKKNILFWEKKMNDENNKIKKLLSDLPIKNKSNFSKAPPHDGATDGHQKSANVTVRQTADCSHDYDVIQNIFSCQKWSFYFRKYLTKLSKNCVGNILQHLGVTEGRKICRKQIVGDITVHHCMIRDINQSPKSLKVQINAKLITQTLFWPNLCDPNWTKMSKDSWLPCVRSSWAKISKCAGVEFIDQVFQGPRIWTFWPNLVVPFLISLMLLYSLHTIGKHIFDIFLWFRVRLDYLYSVIIWQELRPNYESP